MTAGLPDTAARPTTGHSALAWQPASVAVLRMAGYPFSWLHALDGSGCADRARHLLAARGEVDAFAREAEELHRQAAGAADRSLLRALRRGRPYPPREEPLSPPFAQTHDRYAQALRRRDDAERAYRAAHHHATVNGANRVLDLFRDTPSLRDMLLVSNESAHSRLVRWLWRADPGSASWRKHDRNNLMTLVRYLQRVCAKNDTTSHFGPLAPARLDATRDGVQWKPVPLHRHTELSRWAVEAVAAALSREYEDVRLLVRPRRAPGAQLKGDTVHLVRLDQRRMSTEVRGAVRPVPPTVLRPEPARLFALCDGDRNIGQLAALTGRPGHEVERHITALQKAGALVEGPDLPYGEEDALGVLRAHLAPLGGDHPALRQCALLAQAVTDLQAAGPDARPQALDTLKELFTEITGERSHRPRHGFYSDNSVFHEHCVGVAGDLVLGQPLVSRMSGDLGLLYDLFLLRPRRRLSLERELLTRWFERRFGPGARVAAGDYLTAFVADLDALEGDYRASEAHVRAVADELEEALLPPAGSTAQEHRVDRSRVTALLDRYGLDEPAVCNPDLMVAAASPEHLARGEAMLVIGDLHAMDDHLSHGSIAPFVDEAFPGYRQEMAERYAALAEPDEVIADVTQCHLNKTFPRITPLGPDIEAHDRSGAAQHKRLRLAELSVELTDGRLRLTAPDGTRLRLVLPPLAWPMLRHNPFAPFGFPTTTDASAVHGAGRAHVPRVRVGDVVLQRELWRLDPAAVAAATAAEEPDAFVRLQALRERLGLPRHIYVRCPGEPKPVYCDMDSPLLAGQLARMAAGVPAGEPLEISEMLPAPDHLWFGDESGSRTCEVRYAVFTSTATPTRHTRRPLSGNPPDSDPDEASCPCTTP
ncbi:lantibiotic dehydratase [Streptomyces sp. NPDC050732]|uniref:lantibiotic dehydratase n=1 Tax=Streptomyces sp. NPDC050732 TaxID=3154632 RepID=UPI003427CC5D